jgi:hypothetical protein
MKKNLIVLLVVTSLVITLSYTFIFAFSSLLPGYDQYYHLHRINQIKTDGYGNILAENIHLPDVLIAMSDMPLLYMRLLPFVFALFNVGVIYLILGRILEEEKQRVFTSLFVIFSPAFIYLHSTYNALFMPVFFVSLAAYLIIEDRYLLSMLSFAAALLLNPAIFFIVLIVLVLFFEKLKSRTIFWPVAAIAASTYVFTKVASSSYIYNLSPFFLITHYITDFGSSYGFGVFGLIIGCIGLALSWKRKKEYAILYYSLAAMLIALLYDASMVIFVEFIMAFMAGYALNMLWNSKWESITLKNYVILLIICGIIFSAGSYINKFAKTGPEYAEIISLAWLEKDYPGKVISHYEYGFLLKALARAEAYTDKNYYLYSNDKIRIDQSNALFRSRDLKNTIDFLSKNEIEYIWINKRMKEGQIWSKEDEGLLFIMHNSPAFQKTYDYLGVEIWRFNG